MCGEGNRDDSTCRLAGFLRKGSKREEFTESTGNPDHKEMSTCL